MAYWWVNQGKTYKVERNGGFLWAPLRDQSGKTPHHWETMVQVKSGDVIFSYVLGKVVSIAKVLKPATIESRPDEFHDSGVWEQIVGHPLKYRTIFDRYFSRRKALIYITNTNILVNNISRH